MKCLYLGAFTEAHNTESYIANAFQRIGCEVVKLEESTATQESIVAAASEHKPDLFLFAKARFRGANQEWPQAAFAIVKMLEAVKPHVGKSACWLFDLMAKEFSPARFEWSRMVSAACDRFVMTDGYTAPQFPNSLVVRQGVPDDVDHECEWEINPRWDVLFLGTPYRERRLLVDALRSRFGSRFRQENNCRGKDLTALIRSCRIVIGPQCPHFANYWSNRLYIATGHGGLFAAPVVSGMDSDGWRSGDNFLALPLEPESMASKVEEYLTKHDAGQLETIRKRGYEHANTHCTYDVRVKQLLAALGLLGVPVESKATEAIDEPTELDEQEFNLRISEVEVATRQDMAAQNLPPDAVVPSGEPADESNPPTKE